MTSSEDRVHVADGSGPTSLEFRHLLRWLRERPFEADTATIEVLRSRFEDLGKRFFAPPPTTFTPDDANGVPVEWAVSDGASKTGTILYLHGGGYAIGSIASHRDLCARLSAASGIPTLSVGYRLAPENPFPAALEDAVTAYRWLLQQTPDPSTIVVAGDSAGGGLAMSLLIEMRDHGLPGPGGAVLFSPLVDLAHEGTSVQSRAAEDPIVTPEGSHSYAVRYLGPNGDYKEPRASALYADLSDLPPVFVQVGTSEVLLDDSLRLARKIRSASGRVDLDVWPGMIHIFPFFAAQVPESREAILTAAAFIKERVQKARNESISAELH